MAELVEERNDKDVHLIEVKEECIEKADEGELLVLRGALPETKEPLKDGGVLSSY